jgi:phenylacetate-CoA ligase
MNRLVSGHVIWPITEWLCGRDTMSRFRHLRQSERLDATELQALQDRKLRRLTALAAAHCPFYAERFRAAGLPSPRDGFGLRELPLLPTLSRQDIRQNIDGMTWHGVPGGATSYTTGGSSGEPLRFYTDSSRQASDWAARLRARRWWGIRPGDREIWLWGGPIELRVQDHLRRWRDAMLNQEILSAFDMSADTMDGYVDRIRCTRPACICGYASSIALLARHALRARGLSAGCLGSERMRAVFTTGEVLLEPDRQVIGEAFGAPVVIEYGSRDGGLIACGCPAGNLHIPQENIIVELLGADGHPVAPGEVGEVVLTNLANLAMPMIRYRIGDLARWAIPPDSSSQASCACGLAHAALAEVHGRLTDQIVCGEGDHVRRMHALSLIYILREVDSIHQFRIVQTDIGHLEVEVVCGSDFTQEVEQDVRRQLARRIGGDVSIEIRRCEHIAPSPSGKHACVVSHVSA